jgi:hypothetical protein
MHSALAQFERLLSPIPLFLLHRDLGTLAFFESIGVPAYFSGCLTLTFYPLRRTTMDRNAIYMVDVANPKAWYIPEPVQAGSIALSHNSETGSNLMRYCTYGLPIVIFKRFYAHSSSMWC